MNATRKFKTAQELFNWLIVTLNELVKRQYSLFNSLSLDTYQGRYAECGILNSFACGCQSSVYFVESALKCFVPSTDDPIYIAEELSDFLQNEVRPSFDENCEISFGCAFVDVLCSFLDGLEVDDVGGVIYVNYYI